MSQTPIYDELRESRLGERTAELGAIGATTVRLVAPHVEGGTINHLACRAGLGGRHRRPIN